MAEVTKQIVQKELNETPVHEIAQSEPIRGSETNEVSTNNERAPRHRKKRRKHKKVKVHRDPQEVKEIKMQRMNMRREGHWNNRFINATIPDVFASKPKKRKTDAFRRTKSPLETVYMDKEISQKGQLPNIATKQRAKESVGKHTQKSFNIRTMGKGQLGHRGKKENIKSEQVEGGSEVVKPKVFKEENGRGSVDHEGNTHITPPKDIILKPKENKLLVRLQEKTKIHPISEPYRKLLVDLIELQGEKRTKQLRTMLEHEIGSIGHDKNACVKIQTLVHERRGLIKTIIDNGAETTLRTLLLLQVVTVSLIEEILRFKAKWEEQFYKLDKPRKVDYCFMGSNYLLEMSNEVRPLCQDELDPFLITRTNRLEALVGVLKPEEESERREMMLKIRACELLLIEEQLVAT